MKSFTKIIIVIDILTLAQSANAPTRNLIFIEFEFEYYSFNVIQYAHTVKYTHATFIWKMVWYKADMSKLAGG